MGKLLQTRIICVEAVTVASAVGLAVRVKEYVRPGMNTLGGNEMGNVAVALACAAVNALVVGVSAAASDTGCWE